MALWELRDDSIAKVEETSFGAEGVRERDDLQRLLRDNIEVVAPDTLIIAEEYGDWSEGRRRVDLLGIDADANLIVIELKRGDTGAHMELQAIRYAAMISTMTFARAVETYQDHLQALGRDEDAAATLLEFLGWEEPQEEEFGQSVRVILGSAEFSKELTTSVMWLNERGLDIRCVRLKPYRLEQRLLLDVQQVIPLPEAAEYQVRVREKAEEKRQAKTSEADFTRYDLRVAGAEYKALWKRGMIYKVVRAAVDGGATPEQLEAFMPRGRPRFVSVDGECSVDEFREKLAQLRTPRGNPYRTNRFITGDDELMRVNGRTYAFSNQWGGPKTFKAIRAIADAFPELGVEYEETVRE